MRIWARSPTSDILLIALSLVGAFYVDHFVMPRDRFMSLLFAVSVLIAAYRLPSRYAVVTAILAFSLTAIAAVLDNLPLLSALLKLLAVLLVSILAILLGRQRQVSAELARNARGLIEQAQGAQKTLHTLIDTLPAGVLVSDPQGTITLANTTANAVLGGRVTGSAYGPVGGYALLWHDGTSFPGYELPLARAIDRGEPSANVEVRVRWEDGTERVILTRATPINNERGNVIAAVEVFQDVTERIETEEALRESQESLARAQELAHLGNWDQDLRTGQLHWSDEVYRIFGTVPEAFSGRVESFFAYVHPDDQEQVVRVIQTSLDDGHPYALDHRIVRPDGAVRVVHQEARLLCDADGQPVRILGTFQDITERKQAEEERERLLHEVQLQRARVEAIVNSTASAIIYVDAASGQVQANPAARQIFGHPFVPEDGPTQYLVQLFHPDGRPFTLDELPSHRALQGRASVQEELFVVQPNQERIPVLASTAAVRSSDGHTVGAVVALQDITALKEVERLREEWTSIIAHDLRQPISVILGYAGLFELDESASPVQHREIAHIIASAQNLNKMIEDLLDVSRIEARRLALQRQTIDLPMLVAMVVERAIVVTTDHQLDLYVDGAVAPVLADPGRIEQVLGNLLANATKYGDPNSLITVAVRQRDDTAIVSVTNHGAGIPPEGISRIFNRFYRTAEARNGRTVGVGLGLYIAKGIVEAHQGQIWVESTLGQTTTFSFTVPLAKVEVPRGVVQVLAATKENESDEVTAAPNLLTLEREGGAMS